MSYPLQQGGGFGASNSASTTSGGGGGGAGNTTSGGGGKANLNPTSIDALYQGILPGGSVASPSNPRQHLSSLNFGSMNAMNMNSMGMGRLVMSPGGGGSNGNGVGVGVGMTHHRSDSASLQHNNHGNSSSSSSHLSSLNSNLSDEIKRLQQLHQLTSSQSAGMGMGMQGLLGVGGGNSAAALQSFNNAALSQRDVSTYLLQQQQQALQQQQQQQQQVLQQQFGANSSSIAAQLMAAAAATSAQHQVSLPTPSMLAASRAAGSATAAVMMGGRPGPGPGAIEPFPEKLHRMLMEVEATGKSHIISFVDEGRAFAIHKPNQFFKEIVPLYFRQSRLSSFKRQLNLYGFELISNGPSRGAYFHELFQRDKPALCRRMRRVAVKVAAKKQQEQPLSTTHNTGSGEHQDQETPGN